MEWLLGSIVLVRDVLSSLSLIKSDVRNGTDYRKINSALAFKSNDTYMPSVTDIRSVNFGKCTQIAESFQEVSEPKHTVVSFQ